MSARPTRRFATSVGGRGPETGRSDLQPLHDGRGRRRELRAGKAVAPSGARSGRSEGWLRGCVPRSRKGGTFMAPANTPARKAGRGSRVPVGYPEWSDESVWSLPHQLSHRSCRMQRTQLHVASCQDSCGWVFVALRADARLGGGDWSGAGLVAAASCIGARSVRGQRGGALAPCRTRPAPRSL